MKAARSVMKDLPRFHVEGLRGLSESATEFLLKHPDEARIAVAAALEAVAAQHAGITQRRTARAVPAHLQPFVVELSEAADTIGVAEAAARLKVSRTTVYDWVKKTTLLGWALTKRGLAIPAEQILGPGKVVPGLAQVVEAIGDPELAWAFLSQDWPFADEVRRPIDKLKAGDVAAVLDAAPSFGTAVT